MPDEAAERTGSLIDGRYKITELMAAGSMGSVYKAERVPVGKLVAIKFLHASFANDSEFQARFERETRVMSKLNHPNCVSVLDFGVWEGSPYLVMDFVDGATLRERLDEERIQPLAALAIARQILSGLAHAHKQDVFHRDVKPANIMISEEIGHGERVRILDFGLARLQGNVGRDATQINMVVGTPNYMAPEQTVPGGVIDGRTDLYAVGVVLYEMIVGERPFQAEDTLQLLGMHRAAPIPRLENTVSKAVEVPEGTQELIDKAMAKSPATRFQTAIEFAEAIDEVLQAKPEETLDDPTIPKSGPTRGKKFNTPAMATTIIGLNTSEVRRERVRRSAASTALFALLLIAGLAGATMYLVKKSSSKKTTGDRANTAATGKPRKGATLDAGHGPAGQPSPPPGAATVREPMVAMVAPDAAVIDSPLDASVRGGPDARLDDAGLPIIGDPDVDQEDKIDPEQVEDPDPDQGKAGAAEDEDPNAPKTAEEAKKKEVVAPAQLATTLHGAVMQIKNGKKDAAVASLQQLWKKSQKSAYIPFLLGNLYFDRTWWSVAMDHYRIAIKKNAGYRKNPVLNRNIVRMLASAKTRGRATFFLRRTIGKPSVYYLRTAARYDANLVVRKYAAALAKSIR